MTNKWYTYDQIMQTVFTPDFFQGNRQRLRELFTGTAPIVLTANGLQQMSTDATYPFKQDSNFWYLTGIDEPNFVLVMDKNKEYIIAPELSHYQEVFDGGLDVEQIQNTTGVDVILSGKDGWKQLESRLKRVKHVATIAAPPAFVQTYGMYTSPARATLIKRVKKINPSAEMLDLSQHMQRMRMVKQPIEIQTIQAAVDATAAAVEYVETKYRAGKYTHEFEVQLDLDRQFWKHGADKHSFDPIVAGGERGLTLHIADKVALDPAKQLLVDVGAEFEHYAADISRTWSMTPSKRFDTVHQAVMDVADYAISLLKPGTILKEYEKQIEQLMGEKLRELGLIKSIGHDTVRQYFPHATSHFLGIDVHDLGDYGRPLEAGVVLTVEPGIYIPEEGIGIRIEDDVLITVDGCQNLSAKLKR